ncbi:MAG: DUF4199 domain-containing protein [Bacteroidota bacterium]|nr:DUF4199 domain-containing protein [Bacteroidota bacterium]MDP3144306.1 DUF4199 domain-containing protein [Bacteroidota bacterium]MDP3556292.1 DUF4199 domain-containing protein [Bacteroidota bacterium]
MNRKALYFGLAYSATVIAFKLFILLGGYSLSTFGYFYSSITSVLLIIPFYYLAIKSVRDKDYGGIIGGKEAVRICLTIFAVSAVIVSVYNYFEFENSGKALAIDYYNSEQFMTFLKAQAKIKAEDYQKIIAEQIKASEVSGFKATTGKLFSFMLIGAISAFITSAIMKKSAK